MVLVAFQNASKRVVVREKWEGEKRASETRDMDEVEKTVQ
jgi:hypothetical protein